MKTIGERLTAVFVELGTTASAFAVQHSLNAPTLYNIVSGRRSPHYQTVVDICRAEPRISAEYLIRGEGQPLRNPLAIDPAVYARALLLEVEQQVIDVFSRKLGRVD